MSYLQIKSVSKSFGNVHAVVDASIVVEKGSFFTFLGPSGCGKTTTLRMIAGFESVSAGNIIMADKDITDVAPEKKEIGMMFQNYALFPHMTVLENVAYGLKIKKLPKAEQKTKAQLYLKMVGLEGYDTRKIIQLSGGEQQRVALARSLVTEPKILLLDEPLSNLDAKMRDEMRFELKRIQHELGITMLYVTHDQNEALMMSDAIAVFHKGRIQQIGTPQDIYQHPKNSFVANFVGQSNLVSITHYEKGIVTIDGNIRLHVSAHREGAKTAAIRTEAVRLADEASTCINSLSATIKNRQFNGLLTYYTVQVGTMQWEITACNDGFTKMYEIGDQAFLQIQPTSIALLED